MNDLKWKVMSMQYSVRWIIVLLLILVGLASGSHFLRASYQGDDEPRFIFPAIEGRGAIVQRPEAVEQPRPGSKLIIDLTSLSTDLAEINPGLSKLARYVNIYAGAGRESAEVEMVVVLHGGATLVPLLDSAYADTTGVDTNPNLELLGILQEQGVQFLICGQSLAHSGYRDEELADGVTVAVSALTALVNKQADGYSLVNLK